MGSFIQEVFNDISLKRDQKLWLSADDSRTQDRLRLVAQFPESSFSRLLSSSPDESCPAIRICRKNSDLCSALREKANLCYAQGDCHAALGLYNQGLQFASPEESGPILSNRSAVWVDLEDWSSGIQDIDLAFKAFKSEDLEDSGKKKTKKLLERKAQCLCSLGRISEAIKVLETLCDIFKVQGGNRNKSKLEQIMSWKKKLEKQHREQGDKVFQDKVQQLPGIDILKSPHPRIPNFSDAIKIEFTKTQGRHCVASRDIQPGELIAQDKPYVWMLDKSEVRNLCWHCFQGLRAPVPCHKCAGVLFCSEHCLEASACYHPYECGLTELFYQANLGAWVLGYRATVMKPAAFYLENASQVSSTNTQLGLGDEDSYYSDDWLTFHNLVTHDGSTGKAAPELMMQSLVAIFLLRCLKYKKYYDSDQDQESNDLKGQLTPTELTLASILHHNMRAAFYNTHEVARIETDGRSMKRVGRATNPTLALINHSCDPNYRRISIGTTTLAYATKLIPKGGEILDNYAQTFDASPKEARLKYLEKYNFQCQCQACRENWPTLEGLSRKLTSLDKQDGYLPPFQGDASRIKAAIKAVEKAEKHIEKLRSCQTPQDEQQQKTRLVELLEIQRSHMLDLRSLIKAPHFKICLAESNLYHTLLLICKQRMT